MNLLFIRILSSLTAVLFLPVLFVLLFPPPARAEFPMPDMIAADSVSGQFVVTGSRQFSQLALMPEVATNDNFVRLEPALLAVSAERFRNALLWKLGVNSGSPWSGKIFLALHPARSLDENVTVTSERFGDGWIYRVALPDVLSRERFARAMTGVLLLELANQRAGSRCAEVPAWLSEGLSQELLAERLQEIILSVPDQVVNGLPVERVDTTARGLDSLTGARRVLQRVPALTFAQLSWPTDAQLSGEDGGVYRASAQLFVDELLGLKDGAAKLRAMLESLPRFYNWQTAFQTAFRKNFSSPLDVEKWWALQTVSFAARSPGAQWTASVSREKLDEILSVPVEMRAASNNLPARAEISLQAVIRNFNPAQQAEILRVKLRDIELAQLRMSPVLATLTAEYRNALADYLGENAPRRATVWNKHASAPKKVSARDTLRTLDALDARRRVVEAAVKPDLLEQ
jgi:hypothetical protein